MHIHSLPYKHTHFTHLHIIYNHTLTYTQAYKHILLIQQTLTHIHTHSLTHTLSLIYSLTFTQTYTHLHTNLHTPTLTQTGSLISTDTRNYTFMFIALYIYA